MSNATTDTETWTPADIRQLREELDLTQEEMAEQLGVRRATISDWERGKQGPSSMARKLLALLAEQS